MDISPPSATRYRAFISYSHADERLAAWLHRALEAYRIPRHIVSRLGLTNQRLVPIFRDRDELATSDDLSATITAALEGSDHLIVVCSPAASASRWVDAEIRRFRILRPKGRVLCLLADEPASSFPPAIIEDSGVEPLAADARDDADGLDGAKLKLVAGLLGIGFDELKQRDAQRRQRRLIAIAAGALAGMSIAIGLAAFALIAERQAERAEKLAVSEAERANQEASTAERTLGLLIDILREADPSRARGAEVPVREVLDRAAARLRSDPDVQPLVRAQLLQAIGDIYDGLGDYERAAALLEDSVSTYSDAVGADDARTLKARDALGTAWWRLGRYDAAEPSLRKVYAQQSAMLGADHTDTLHTADSLASLLFRRGDYAGAEALYRHIWETQRAGADEILTLGALHNLANVIEELGRTAEAAAHFEHILARRRELQGEDHPDALGAAANLASAYTTLGRLDEAEALEVAVRDARVRVLGPGHPDTLTSLNNLAYLLGVRGKDAEAEPLYRQVVEGRTRILGPEHPSTLEGRLNLGMTLRALGRYEAALAELSAAAARLPAAAGVDHPSSLLARSELAITLAWAGRNAEAERALEETLPDLERALGPGHKSTLDALYNLACLAARQGKVERALDRLEQAVGAGFRDPAIREDPDLVPLHGDKRFVAIVARLTTKEETPADGSGAESG